MDRGSLMGGRDVPTTSAPTYLPKRVIRAILAVGVCLASSAALAQGTVKASSGHHYSFLEGAQIGHDFGRNPFAQSLSDAESLGFATSFGRSKLRRALERAVAAGEARMSFDLGFDFRSVVVFENGEASSLDDWALGNVTAFLQEVDAADANARRQGGRFAADVVLVDHAVADGVSREGLFTVGEHPELITNVSARAKLLDVLSPVLKKLVSSDRVTINLMNEPEFVSMSALDAAQRIREGRFGLARLVTQQEGLRKVSVGSAVADLLEGADRDRYVRVLPGVDGSVDLSFTEISSSDLRVFLVGLWRTVIDATALRGDFDGNGHVGFDDFLIFAGSFGLDVSSPEGHPACDLTGDGVVAFADFVLFAEDFGRATRRPEVTIGWADDLSALDNTRIIEDLAGEVVTDVISFHVYDVPENRFHPLSSTRDDFLSAGYGDRPVRITEWGLGSLSSDQTAGAIASAFGQVASAGFDGVLFWWDSTHVFDYDSYRLACD